jgi:hypothetical protein
MLQGFSPRRRPGRGLTVLVLALAMLLPMIVVMVRGAAAAPRAQPCLAEALAALQRAAPDGFRVYAQLERKTDFTQWIDCANVQLGLTTAVHEGTHILTDQLGAYPLIGGGTAPRVGASRSLVRPGVVAGRFPPDSSFVTTYLKPGAATSAEEFGYLLDELNAYSHDLDAAVRLRRLASPDYDVFHRDGLSALMAFVAAYVERARMEDAITWQSLRDAAVKPSVVALWAQAERVMGASCRVPRYGDEAPGYLAPVCAANIRHGLGVLLGRPPLCPVSCLRTASAAGTTR